MQTVVLVSAAEANPAQELSSPFIFETITLQSLGGLNMLHY